MRLWMIIWTSSEKHVYTWTVKVECMRRKWSPRQSDCVSSAWSTSTFEEYMKCNETRYSRIVCICVGAWSTSTCDKYIRQMWQATVRLCVLRACSMLTCDECTNCNQTWPDRTVFIRVECAACGFWGVYETIVRQTTVGLRVLSMRDGH